MKRIVKGLLIVLGTLFIILGTIGIFLPLLPTTPFLLLGALCYLKGSKKLYHILINNRYLGVYIKNYYEKKGIPLKTKIIVTTLLWISMSYSALVMIDHIYLKFLLFIIATIVTYHILSQETLKGGINHGESNTEKNDDFKIDRVCD